MQDKSVKLSKLCNICGHVIAELDQREILCAKATPGQEYFALYRRF